MSNCAVFSLFFLGLCSLSLSRVHLSARYPVASEREKTVVYHAPVRGQSSSIGNMLFGLAAALSFSHEIGAAICVDWPAFNRFVRAHPVCPQPDANVAYFNFGTSDRRETIYRRGRDSEILRWTGNRIWNATHVFPYFVQTACRRVLRRRRFRVVAHIRNGDRGILHRADGWSTLRRCLPKDAYIVSDSNLTYTELPEHRRHSNSMAIRHLDAEERRMWYDWCVIRQAATVYYTPSGFSESAFYFARAKYTIRLDETYSC